MQLSNCCEHKGVKSFSSGSGVFKTTQAGYIAGLSVSIKFMPRKRYIHTAKTRFQGDRLKTNKLSAEVFQSDLNLVLKVLCQLILLMQSPRHTVQKHHHRNCNSGILGLTM